MLFEENMGLSEVLFQIKVQIVIKWSSRLQKHQTLETFTKVDFFAFVKTTHIDISILLKFISSSC